MRIAFVSYEYAGHANGGGIGTYVRSAARMLTRRGHIVEVFTGTEGGPINEIPFCRVHLIDASRADFPSAVLPAFARAHTASPFDVLETAEFGGDAAAIASAFPALPRVVKLHMASYQIDRVNAAYVKVADKARFVAGALRRGRAPKPYWGKYDATADIERTLAVCADEVTSPSVALLDLTMKDWKLGADRTAVIPNPFEAQPDLLTLTPGGAVPIVTFIGRLEVRKGVMELARALPAVLREVPNARLRFVGKSLLHPATHEPMEKAILRIAGSRAAASIEFVGAVPYPQLPEILKEAAVCVFPSYWENFPYVCLEAMGAGCAVIGSSAGGMAEIIENNRTGLLVPPKDPQAISDAVISLLEDSRRRAEMGKAARQHVLTAYSPQVIAPLQEASYIRAIERANTRRAGTAAAAQ